MDLARPIADSYWVVPGELLAGEYPGAREPHEARRKISSLLEANIRLFIDLTEPGEHGLQEYWPTVVELAGQLNLSVEHRRMAVRDVSIPDESLMIAILDVIDEAIAENTGAYVHCFGGIGRTGTVVGCYLVRHGLSGVEALRRIRDWRTDTPDGWRESPETDAQRNMVLAWAIGK